MTPRHAAWMRIPDTFWVGIGVQSAFQKLLRWRRATCSREGWRGPAAGACPLARRTRRGGGSTKGGAGGDGAGDDWSTAGGANTRGSLSSRTCS
jgi:hypothetical protein